MSLPNTLTLPGAVDLHVHFREPSNNEAETIGSGTDAAYVGGYALVADMPNNPGNPTWTEERILEKHRIITNTARIAVATYAGSQPDHDNIGELAKMAPHAIGLKLYGAPTTGNAKDFTGEDFRPIVSEWHKVAPDKPIMLHAGESNLEDMIQLVANEFDHQLHICHVNNPSAVRLINDFRKLNFPITSGVTPHHLFKTSHDVNTQGWFARMQPPLVRQNETEELFDQLVSGQIDVVETDHAPHSRQAKWKAENNNPDGIHDEDHTTCFGVPGIEFALPLLLYQLKKENITLDRIIDATSTIPASILGVKIKPTTYVEWVMDEYRIEHETSQTAGKSGWTPYLGLLAVGRVFISRAPMGRVISQRGDAI